MKNFYAGKTNSGYTLVEMIFYVALFAFFSIILINSLVIMTKAFRETAVLSELSKGGDILERISREIRKANSIDSISAGLLSLGTKNDSGQDATVSFALSGSDINMSEDGSPVGNLNPENIEVTSLNFTQINTAKGTAVGIILSVRSSRDLENRVEYFYNTVVLRGDY